VIAHRVQAGLRPDPARVIARLFLPGEELHSAHSRASQVVGRVLGLAEGEVERLAAGLLRDFGGRHRNYQEFLRRHASIVSAHIEEAGELTARTLLLGATFTAEYATEAAALCAPGDRREHGELHRSAQPDFGGFITWITLSVAGSLHGSHRGEISINPNGRWFMF
jgi:hypothetical protein